MRICQGFHKIRFHRSPLLQIQPQSEKLSCKNEPDFMLFVLVLQIVSVQCSVTSQITMTSYPQHTCMSQQSIYVSLMYRPWKILLSNMSRPETFAMTLVTLCITAMSIQINTNNQCQTLPEWKYPHSHISTQRTHTHCIVNAVKKCVMQEYDML